MMIVDGAGGPFGAMMKNCTGPEPEKIAGGSVPIQNLSPFEGDGSRELESFYRFNDKGGDIGIAHRRVCAMRKQKKIECNNQRSLFASPTPPIPPALDRVVADLSTVRRRMWR